MPLQVIGVIFQALMLGIAVPLEVMESLSVLSPAEKMFVQNMMKIILPFKCRSTASKVLFFGFEKLKNS